MLLPRLSFLIAVFLPFSAQAQNQVPVYEWVATAGGAKNDKTRGVTLDREGNVFLTGEVTEDTKFGNIEVKSAGGMDCFLAKLDSKGHFIWATTLGGPLTDRGYGVATDHASDVYVTGHRQITEGDKVNGVVPKGAGRYDGFIAKYSREGQLQWEHPFGGRGYNYGHGIVVDGKGDILITGGVAGEARFGDVLVTNDASNHVFCAKYNAAGKLLWVKIAKGKGANNGQAISLDGADNIYITGENNGASTFGTKEISAKNEGVLVMKLNSEGEPLWVTSVPSSARSTGSCIAADASGRCWISGIFHGQVTLNGQTYPSMNEDPKNSDGFVAAFDTEGHLQWGHALVGPSIDYCLGVATDGKGQSFVTGEFSETSTFAGQTLTSRGMTDSYLASIDERGKLLWISQSGGPKGDNAYIIATDGAGSLVYGGACMAPAEFGEQKVTTTGGADLYVAKLKYR